MPRKPHNPPRPSIFLKHVANPLAVRGCRRRRRGRRASLDC